VELLLLRHAKSSWDDDSLSDHDRPLAARGRRAADRLAEYFVAEGARPALVLCSSARRARETLAPIVAAIGPGVDVRVEEGLYGASAPELLARVQEAPPAATPLLIVGHNPGLHDLALGLARDAGAELRAKFPTGAVVALDTGGTGWAGLTWGSAQLTRFITPRTL